jgi:alpha-ribazole phosphatase
MKELAQPAYNGRCLLGAETGVPEHQIAVGRRIVGNKMEGESFLWLVRHAAVAGVDGMIHSANAPADLSDRAPLDAVRRHLPSEAASYASPARRTIDTARALGLDPVLMAEFAEQDFGAWTGQRHDDLAAGGEEGYAQFWQTPARSRPPGGESFEDQVARTGRGLLKLQPGASILVVHSGTIRAALCIALDIDPEAALRFVIQPLSITRIDRLRNGWRVGSVNQCVHDLPEMAMREQRSDTEDGSGQQ